jgi:hypothetical protein
MWYSIYQILSAKRVNVALNNNQILLEKRVNGVLNNYQTF